MTKAKYRDHGEGFGVSWQVYPAGTTLEQIEADGWELGGRNGGPGRPFTSTVSVRRTTPQWDHVNCPKCLERKAYFERQGKEL